MQRLGFCRRQRDEDADFEDNIISANGPYVDAESQKHAVSANDSDIDTESAPATVEFRAAILNTLRRASWKSHRWEINLEEFHAELFGLWKRQWPISRARRRMMAVSRRSRCGNCMVRLLTVLGGGHGLMGTYVDAKSHQHAVSANDSDMHTECDPAPPPPPRSSVSGSCSEHDEEGEMEITPVGNQLQRARRRAFWT
jgi:hypothetical protein